MNRSTAICHASVAKPHSPVNAERGGQRTDYRIDTFNTEDYEQLIDSLVTDFDPAAYEDRYHEQVVAFLHEKAEGREVAVPEPVEDTGEVIDLMAALERSLEAGRGTGASGTGAPTDDYEGLSKSALYELAQKRDLEGRSSMSKAELVTALRASDAAAGDTARRAS